MQVPAAQALRTVTKKGWLTPGDCGCSTLAACCAAALHAKASKIQAAAVRAILLSRTLLCLGEASAPAEAENQLAAVHGGRSSCAARNSSFGEVTRVSGGNRTHLGVQHDLHAGMAACLNTAQVGVGCARVPRQARLCVQSRVTDFGQKTDCSGNTNTLSGGA